MQFNSLRNHWLLYFAACNVYPLMQLYVCLANEFQFTSSFLVRSYLFVPFFTYICLPILDIVTTEISKRFPRPKDDPLTKQNKEYYHWILYYYTAVHTIAYIATFYHGMHLSGLPFLLFACSSGLFMAVANVYAHELMHKLNKVDVFLAKYLLTLVSYTHFAIGKQYEIH